MAYTRSINPQPVHPSRTTPKNKKKAHEYPRSYPFPISSPGENRVWFDLGRKRYATEEAHDLLAFHNHGPIPTVLQYLSSCRCQGLPQIVFRSVRMNTEPAADSSGLRTKISICVARTSTLAQKGVWSHVRMQPSPHRPVPCSTSSGRGSGGVTFPPGSTRIGHLSSRSCRYPFQRPNVLRGQVAGSTYSR